MRIATKKSDFLRFSEKKTALCNLFQRKMFYNFCIFFSPNSTFYIVQGWLSAIFEMECLLQSWVKYF